MAFNYSKRAFHFSVFSLILMAVFLVLSTIERTKSNTGMNDVTGYLITLFFVTVLVGFILSVIGLREPSNLKKIAALVINVGLFLLLGYAVVQNLMDMDAFFSA